MNEGGGEEVGTIGVYETTIIIITIIIGLLLGASSFIHWLILIEKYIFDKKKTTSKKVFYEPTPRKSQCVSELSSLSLSRSQASLTLLNFFVLFCW